MWPTLAALRVGTGIAATFGIAGLGLAAAGGDNPLVYAVQALAGVNIVLVIVLFVAGRRLDELRAEQAEEGREL
jgi:hypothetical protein